MRRIAVYAAPRTPLHLLATPHAVFGHRGDEGSDYLVTWFADVPGDVPTSDGVTLIVNEGLEATVEADLVVIPAWNENEEPGRELLDALIAAHARGATLVGLCVGSLVIAATGVLGGRPIATHWSFASELHRRYGVRVDPGPLWIDHGDVITSAGSTAGYDCCLHLVRSHHGAEAAAAIARRLVLAPHRDGNQAQYVRRPAPRHADHSLVADAMTVALSRIGDALELDDWAGLCGTSRRTLTRQFRAELGVSPHEWLIAARLDAARGLLEAGDDSVDAIATRVGYSNASSLRAHFLARFDTTPSRYRRTHRERAA